MSPTLIRLLGPVGLGEDPASVRVVGGRLPSAVLAELAIATGRLVTSDALVDAVWDDDPPATARNAIQVAISRLRGVLGPDNLRGTRGGYLLRTALLRVDWTEATQLHDDATSAVRSGQWASAVALADQALDLFGGEPLAGLDSTAARTFRETAANLKQRLVLVRARGAIEVGDPGTAERILQPFVAADPTGEPAAVLRIEALAAAGHQAAALEAYETLRRELADSLGVDPGAEARALFQRVLSGEIRLSGSGPVVRPPAERVELPGRAGPLLGRDADLTHLTGLLDDGHRLVTLLGPGGIGKTSLAVQAARLWAERERSSALFVDLAALDADDHVERQVESVVDPEGVGLALALAAAPTLVVLDNAEHVLDGAAAAVPRLLADPRAKVVVTSRSALRLGGERPVSVEPLDITGLDGPAARLLADHAGLGPEDLEAERDDVLHLLSSADGVPLVLELFGIALRWRTAGELVALIASDYTAVRDTAGRDRPDRHTTIRAAVAGSLNRTPLAGRRALRSLAMIHGTFTHATATAVISAALPGEAPDDVLGDLLDRSLLLRQRTPGRILFRLLEPVRQAVMRDDVGDETALERAWAEHFAGWLIRAEELLGDTADELAALQAADNGNVERAVAWLWAADGVEAVPAVAAGLYYWYFTDRPDLVDRWCALATAAPIGETRQRELLVARLMNAVYYRNLPDRAIDDLAAEVEEGRSDPDDQQLHPHWRFRRGFALADYACMSSRFDVAYAEAGGVESTGRRDRHRVQSYLASLLLRERRYRETREAVQSLSWSDPGSDIDLQRWVSSLSMYATLALGDHTSARAEGMTRHAVEAAEGSLLGYTSTLGDLLWVYLCEADSGGFWSGLEALLESPVTEQDALVLTEAVVASAIAARSAGRAEAATNLYAVARVNAEQYGGLLLGFPLDQFEWLTAMLGPDVVTAPPPAPALPEVVALMRDLARDRPELVGPTRGPLPT